ncbi:OB-fold protein [Pantoea anthophila]|uniref:OB-fold protein n=1 Tax=Pantoea anthophila TaxID=470931 RepID=UPI003CE86B1D
MKKIMIIWALFASALAHADELTPFLPSDSTVYNQVRDIAIEDDKQAFLSGSKRGSFTGDNMEGPVTPDELYKSYERNELAANKIYKGVSVRVIGTANEIGEDALGKPYIDAISGKSDGLSSLRSVKLYFSEASERLLKLAKGDKIDLICVGKGYFVHTPVLDQCYFSADLNIDNLLGGVLLPAEKLTIENLAKLPDSNAMQMNLFIMFGVKASNDKIKTVCNKSSKKCLNFVGSDEFGSAIIKFMDDHKDEIKLLATKVAEMKKEFNSK